MNKQFVVAVLDDDGDPVSQTKVWALGATLALNMIAFGPDSRLKALIREGRHEISVTPVELLDGEELEEEAA